MSIKYLFSFEKCVFEAIPIYNQVICVLLVRAWSSLYFLDTLSFICMHMCWVCTHVYMYLNAGLCAYFWRPEVEIGYLLISFHFISQDRVSHVNPELANLGKLASLLQGCRVSAGYVSVGYVLGCDYRWATTAA